MVKIVKWSGNWFFESDARDRKSLSKSYFDSCINVFKMNLNDSERNFAKTTLEWPISAHFGPFQAISGQFRSFSLSIWRNVHERSSKCHFYKNLTKRFSECPSDLILWQGIWCILNIKTQFVTLPSVTTYRSTLPPTQVLYKCRVFWFKITVMISTARLLHKVSCLFIELASLN